jgi:hypothetical protein
MRIKPKEYFIIFQEKLNHKHKVPEKPKHKTKIRSDGKEVVENITLSSGLWQIILKKRM